MCACVCVCVCAQLRTYVGCEFALIPFDERAISGQGRFVVDKVRSIIFFFFFFFSRKQRVVIKIPFITFIYSSDVRTNQRTRNSSEVASITHGVFTICAISLDITRDTRVKLTKREGRGGYKGGTNDHRYDRVHFASKWRA